MFSQISFRESQDINTNNLNIPISDQTPKNSSLPVMTEKVPATSPLQHFSLHHRFSPTNNKAEYDTINSLPYEIKYKIFHFAGEAVEFSVNTTKGLLSYAKSSRQCRNDVENFLKKDAAGIVLANRFKNSRVKFWQTTAKNLPKTTSWPKSLRAQSDDEFLVKFLRRNAGFTEALTPNKHLGIQIPFAALEKYTKIASDLTREISSGLVIKFNAEGIGRQRVLTEVFPALLDAAPGCPLVVSLSGNNLTEDDLKPLTAFMAKNPAIYQLDLSDNILCNGDTLSEGIKELFRVLGPVSHLCLRNIGLNDRTAEAIEEHIKYNSCLMHLDLRQNTLSHNRSLSIVEATSSNDYGDVISADAAINLQRTRCSVRLQKISFWKS